MTALPNRDPEPGETRRTWFDRLCRLGSLNASLAECEHGTPVAIHEAASIDKTRIHRRPYTYRTENEEP